MTSGGGAVRALVCWYEREARDLPWRRRASEPYAVWVSEIMLQQTRVEVVRSYYERFLGLFPDAHRLAAASEQEVLAAWEGLGYYRRARRLHQAACWLVRERAGRLPGGFNEWRQLPGIGLYTAGALASICNAEAVPAIDGNARRVLGRWLAQVASTTGRDGWIDRAASLLVRWSGAPGTWNQALMELGARICLPRRPRCEACPVLAWCRTGRRGAVPSGPSTLRIPAAPRVVAWVWLVSTTAPVRWLTRQRPADGRWGGLWEFPTWEGPAASAADAWGRWTHSGLPRRWGRVALPSFEHRLTHRLYEFRPVLLAPSDPRTETGSWPDDVTWTEPRRLSLLPMGVPHQRLRRLVLDPSELARWLGRARGQRGHKGHKGRKGAKGPEGRKGEAMGA